MAIGRTEGARPRATRTWYVVADSLVGAWAVAAAVAVLLRGGLRPVGWAPVHLLLLGAASTAVLIWSQHFADTLLRRPAPGGRRGLEARLAVHTAGALGVVVGVVARLPPVVLAGGILVGAVAVLHGAVLAGQLRAALPSRFGPLVRYYVAAAAALLVGVALGVLLAGPVLKGDLRERGYLAHVAFNVLGWIGLTVVGTVILLWPTILRTRIPEHADAAGRRALPVLSAGIALVGLACLLDARPVVSAGLLVYLAGLALVLAWVVREALAAPPRTYAGWSMGASLAWFAGCAAALAVLAVTAGSWQAVGQAVDDLALPFAVGFVAQVVAAALSHLLPVVLGGGPAVVKRTARELDRAAALRVLVVNGGLSVVLLPVPAVVALAASVLLLAALLSVLALAVRAAVVARRGSADAEHGARA